MGRKQSVDFNDTTLETWKAVIPADCYELKNGDKEIVIMGAVKIQYGGLDDSNTVKKFNSAEYCYLFIDQAEEVSRDDFGLLRGTLRRKINNTDVDYKALLTANPAICWLKDVFIVNKDKGCEFIQALPSDNPFIAEGYVDNLREAFKHRPELVKAYVEGDWDVMSGANLVIKPSWVEKAKTQKLHMPYKNRLIACDVARFGDNETVIYVFEGPRVIHQEIYGQRSLMETAGTLVALKNKFNAKLIVVDSCGVGGGIVDRLAELREPHLGVNVGEKPTVENNYFNLRTQVVWEAADYFAKENVTIPDDQTLINQLGLLTYEMQSNGKIRVRSKEEIKKNLGGNSPDRADALLLGLYSLKFIPEEQSDFRRGVQISVRQDAYGWGQKREMIYGR